MKVKSKKIGTGVAVALGLLAALAGVFEIAGVANYSETADTELAEFCIGFLNQRDEGLGNYSGVIELAEKISPFLEQF